MNSHILHSWQTLPPDPYFPWWQPLLLFPLIVLVIFYLLSSLSSEHLSASFSLPCQLAPYYNSSFTRGENGQCSVGEQGRGSTILGAKATFLVIRDSSCHWRYWPLTKEKFGCCHTKQWMENCCPQNTGWHRMLQEWSFISPWQVLTKSKENMEGMVEDGRCSYQFRPHD